jgi:hypothetical protein
MTAANAAERATMPSASLPTGSPKTSTPPAMAATFAAIDERAITWIAAPSWRPRASDMKAARPAPTASRVHGLIRLVRSPWNVPLSALMATFPTPIMTPAAMASRTPSCPRARPLEPCNSRVTPMATAPPSKAISAAAE